MHRNKNGWITQGIKTSCECKRRLYIYSRHKAFYVKYCKILNNIIQQAKRQYCNRLIAKYDDKIKTTWNIIESSLGS